eukprot:Partr_v1_DN28665_c1_g1_i1_m49470 putative Cell cycle regulatory protein
MNGGIFNVQDDAVPSTSDELRRTPSPLIVVDDSISDQTSYLLSPKSLQERRKHSASPSWMISPQKMSRRRVTSSQQDRYIPDRSCANLNHTAFHLNNQTFGSPTKTSSGKFIDNDVKSEESKRIYSQVLKSEIFGPSLAQHEQNIPSNGTAALQSSAPVAESPKLASPLRQVRHKLLHFHSSAGLLKDLRDKSKPRSARKLDFTRLLQDPSSDTYSTSPVSSFTQRTLQSPRKPPRNIPRIPFKVLDAPDLADDFYLNVVDWGSTNMLGVGLGNCVYMWSACTSHVTKLCDLGPYDSISSLSWAAQGSQIAIGTGRGTVQLWDAARCSVVRSMAGHSARVGSLAWNGSILSSGSRDRSILHRDIRSPSQFVRRLSAHKQEVCGLKWNVSDNQLASGGNDNKLFVWDKMDDEPMYRLASHSAAVKAICWSPHQRSLLCSGGGTADRRIKFWNTQTGSLLQSIDTGSQVCNLAWSKNSNEIVSTHGYSQNQIVVWRYGSMQQIATLTGHSYRVLYLAMSPDGQSVVTGAGDETLRFWNVFAKRKLAESGESIITGSPRSIR